MADHHRHNNPCTSGTHADLDLMDFDEIMVVPDTPDRVSRQPKNIRTSEFSSKHPGVAKRVTVDRLGRHPGDSTHAAVLHSGDNFGVKARSQSASWTAVPSSTVRNTPVSNLVAGKTLNHNDRHQYSHQFMDEGNVSHSGFLGRSSHHHKRSKDPILVEQGDDVKSSTKSTRDDIGTRKMNHSYILPNKSVSIHAAEDSKFTRSDIGARKMNTSYILPNKSVSVHTAGGSPTCNRNNNKGKMKVGYDNPVHWDVRAEKRNDDLCLITSVQDAGKGFSLPPHTSRAPVQKKLVRNGCISPSNIAKAKKLEETFCNGSGETKIAEVHGGSHPVINVNEVDAKQNVACRAKGKGLLIHDSPPKGLSGSRSDVGHHAGVRGKGKYPASDCYVDQDPGGNSNKDILGKVSSSLPSISLEQKPDQSEGQLHTLSSSIKRQKKHGLSSGTPDKGTEVICLSSGGESSTMKSVRYRGSIPQKELGSPLVVDENSPEVRESISQTENDSEAMALQLQADEMLARELQEQLYNEIPEFSGGERYSTSGLLEQLEDSVQLASSRRNHHAHAPVRRPPSNRPPASQPQSLRNRLFRRGGQARPPRSNVPRLRSRAQHHSTRDRLFPSEMDLDMRIDLLETLEAVVSDDIRMVNELLDPDREFGENDYEMLLALDENNHTHLGASVTQIANLPESTVHMDNCEACSICLENPVLGDTMRHLPCLHKFHKDCIDPWLRRKRSCPICKSDI